MHSFQPFDVTQLDINPFTLISEDWGVLTAMADGKCNSMTISWGGMGVLWGKNVVTVYVRESRFTKELLDKSDSFSITFLKENQRNLLKYLGSVSGRDEDKYKTAKVKINLHNGVPFLDEGYFAVIAKKLAAYPMPKDGFIAPDIDSEWYPNDDYHTMYIGEITEFMAR